MYLKLCARLHLHFSVIYGIFTFVVVCCRCVCGYVCAFVPVFAFCGCFVGFCGLWIVLCLFLCLIMYYDNIF